MIGPRVLLSEEIEGPRIVLRRWRREDAPALSAAVERNMEHLRPWMPWISGEPLQPAARVELIEGWERQWAEGGDAVYGVFDGDTVVGGCGLHHRVGPYGLEIGYWVDKDHLRIGIATGVARMLTTAGLAVEGISFVEIHHDPANVASGRIPRRLGYTLTGEDDHGHLAWRMEGADWSARTPAIA